MGFDLPPNIGAVCFDAFGTLVEIQNERRSYLRLYRELPSGKRREFKRRMMIEDRAMEDWGGVLGHEFSQETINAARCDLQVDLTSMRLRPGVEVAWQKIRRKGLKIGLCSNLAAPYTQNRSKYKEISNES